MTKCRYKSKHQPTTPAPRANENSQPSNPARIGPEAYSATRTNEACKKRTAAQMSGQVTRGPFRVGLAWILETVPVKEWIAAHGSLFDIPTAEELEKEL